MKLIDKTNKAKENLKTSKDNLAAALRYADIPDVLDNQTYKWYADKIIKFRSDNSFVVKLTIPNTTENVLRTLILPIRGLSFNAINFDIIRKQYPTTTIYPNWGFGTPADGYEFTCDYGDGLEITYKKGDDITKLWHTYDPGIYYLSIKGVFPYLENQYTWGNSIIGNSTYPVKPGSSDLLQTSKNYGWNNCVEEVTNWGYIQFKSLNNAFASCTSLKSIPILDNLKTFYEVVSLNYTFFNTRKLTTIPYDTEKNRGLFSNCVNLTSAAGMFYNGGLKGVLSSGLFKNCPKLTNASSMFTDCRLTDVPTDIFEECESLQNVEAFLKYNYTYTGSPNLFSSSKQLKSIYSAFIGTKTTGIIDSSDFPSTLTNAKMAFKDCPNITGFTNDAFKNLGSCDLSFAFMNSGVTNIPDISKLGANSSLKLAFYNTKIKSFSDNALANIRASNSPYSVFAGITTLTGNVPNLIQDAKDNERFGGMFGGCTGLTGFNNLPAELGGLKASDSKIGDIVLADGTIVSPADFVLDKSNMPRYIIFEEIGVDSNNHWKADSTTRKRYGVLLTGGQASTAWFNPVSLAYQRQISKFPDTNAYSGKEYTNKLLAEMTANGWNLTDCPVYNKIHSQRVNNQDTEIFIPTLAELLRASYNRGRLLNAIDALKKYGLSYSFYLDNSWTCSIVYDKPNQQAYDTRMNEQEYVASALWWGNYYLTYMREWIL